jgi:Hydrogenase maturation factor
MEEGKIDYELLEKMISRYSFRDKSVVIGPNIGIDCTVLDAGKEYIVATTDPVTFVSSAEYCINVNVNDVVSMGAEPWFFMATIILPPKSREKELDTIMKEISNGCKRFKINFGGGHTEVNPIVKEPLISGFMVGRCKKSELRGSFNAKDGDVVLLTKGISIEGTTIIAEKRKEEIEREWGKEFLERCQSFKKQLSVLKEAQLAKRAQMGCTTSPRAG